MADLRSRQNPKVKLARGLHQRKLRLETGLFLVEGLHHLGELVDSDFQVEYVLSAPETLAEFGTALMARFQERGVVVHAAGADVLDYVGGRSGGTAAVAVVRQRLASLDGIDPSAGTVTVAAVAPQDPGNIGAILRTMDAVQAGALLLLDGGADPWQPAAVRASMGAAFWHPIVRAAFADFAAWARLHGLHVYGTSAHADVDYRAIDAYAHPRVLLLGSEREGLTPEQAAACEQLIHLPMHGRATSLNLAVAAGIMLYAMNA